MNVTFDLNVDLLGVNDLDVPEDPAPRPDGTMPPSRREYAAWLAWKGAADLVDMLGFGAPAELCGAHKSGYHCPLEPRHSGKHRWVRTDAASAA